MEKTLIAELVQNRIFFGLTAGQLERILPCITSGEQTYAAGETILHRGESLPQLGIVLGGEISLCNCGRNCECGPECTGMETVEKNEIFGEAVAFSSDCVVPCDIVALQAARVLYLAPNFFLMPCGKDCANAETHRVILANMLQLLSDKAVRLGRKVDYLSAPDLRSKIAMYLCDLYDVTGSRSFCLPLNRDGLAEFLSVARPSLSREMVRMKEEGLIDFQRSKVTLLDPEGLRALTRRNTGRP